MSILEELVALLGSLGIAVETGVFSGKAPDEYIVITPLSEVFELYADNCPHMEAQEARLSLYSRGNYRQRKNQIVRALLGADFTVTDRRYIEHENDTGYHHFAIDTAKIYNLEG
jgi:hypothetical protein